MKPLDEMSAAELERADTKAHAAHMRHVDAMIDAGRGTERYSDVKGMTDPLSLAYLETAARSQDISAEKSRRMTYHGNLKPIKRKGNPIMATAAQMAARKLFAARARAGAFRGKTDTRFYPPGHTGGVEAAEASLRVAKKHAARKKNPVTQGDAERRHWRAGPRDPAGKTATVDVYQMRGTYAYCAEVRYRGDLLISFDRGSAAELFDEAKTWALKQGFARVKVDKGAAVPGAMTRSAAGVVRQNPKARKANPVGIDDLRSGSSYANRATIDEVRKRLDLLAQLIGASTTYGEKGALAFDRHAGGIMLVQYTGNGGGERDLSERMKLSEMLTYLDGAVMVARAVK